MADDINSRVLTNHVVPSNKETSSQWGLSVGTKAEVPKAAFFIRTFPGKMQNLSGAFDCIISIIVADVLLRREEPSDRRQQIRGAKDRCGRFVLCVDEQHEEDVKKTADGMPYFTFQGNSIAGSFKFQKRRRIGAYFGAR
jgi:hypothetical protein